MKDCTCLHFKEYEKGGFQFWTHMIYKKIIGQVSSFDLTPICLDFPLFLIQKRSEPLLSIQFHPCIEITYVLPMTLYAAIYKCPFWK